MGIFPLSITDDVYERARLIAEERRLPIEKILIAWVVANIPDENQERRIKFLMHKNSLSTITREEYRELGTYNELIYDEPRNHLMVRKAEAARILMKRGHKFLYVRVTEW